MNPIRYFGGKGTMVNTILKYFPPKYNMYVEPFGGAYSVGFKQQCRVEIYNDLEKNVYSLFKVLSDPTLFPEFKKKCDLAYYCNDLREESKQMLKLNNLSIVDRAFCFFCINRTSQNGVGGFSINTIVRRNMSKSVSDMLSAIDGLTDFHHRLSKVIVSNYDGCKIIKRCSKPDTLFYCDPPYPWSTRGNVRYTVDMDEHKHQEFLDTVLNNKSLYLISGYDNDQYKILEANGFKRIDFPVKTTTGTHQKKTKIESLWLNYNKGKQNVLFM